MAGADNLVNVVINLVNLFFIPDFWVNNLVSPFFMIKKRVDNVVTPFFILDF